MKKQRWLVLLLVAIFVLSAGVLTACGKTTYTVTFMADGKEVSKVEAEAGKPVTFPQVPAKEGFTGKWDPEKIDSASADVTVNAVYTPVATTKTFTITFKADGTVVKEVKVDEGKSVTFPTAPAKEGYTVVWSPASIEKATADVTVNAVYTKVEDPVGENTATVSFDVNGADEKMEAIVLTKGTVLAEPTKPVKAGHTFKAWYADAAFLDEFDFTQPINEDTVIYVDWTKNTYTVTLPTSYINAINNVSFAKTTVAGNTYMMLTKDDPEADHAEDNKYSVLADGAEVEYGTVVYFVVGELATSGKDIAVYVNGEQVQGKDLPAQDCVLADGTVLFDVDAITMDNAKVYAVKIEEDTAISAENVFTVTFDAGAGAWNDGTPVLVVMADGTVVLPETTPEKTGYTFVGWFNEATCKTAFEPKDIAACKTVYAKYRINDYAVSATTAVEGVKLELSKTTAPYEEIIGLRVVDNREDKEVPLLVRVNGKMLLNKGTTPDTAAAIMKNAVGDSQYLTDKIFDIQITENTEITITEEYRYTGYTFKSMTSGYANIEGVEHVYASEALTTASQVPAEFFTTNYNSSALLGNVDGTSDDTINKFLVAGDEISFYVQATEGYTLTLAADEELACYALSHAKATAAIGAWNDGDAYDHYLPVVNKGGEILQKYKVTITLPAIEDEDDANKYQIVVKDIFEAVENTYEVKGLNVEVANEYILKQATIDPDDGIIFDIDPVTTFEPNNNKVTSKLDANEYVDQIVFVKLAADKDYIVTMNGIKIFNTLDTTSYEYKIDGVKYKAWVSADNNISLYQAYCDQNWNVIEYRTVEIVYNQNKTATIDNKDDFDTLMGGSLSDLVTFGLKGSMNNELQVETGSLWQITIPVEYAVKIDGRLQTGVLSANRTFRTYTYQIKADTTVEVLQKYEITYSRPGGTENVTIGDKVTECLYGDKVTATIIPENYASKIMVVKATATDGTIMLSEEENVYSFVAGKEIGNEDGTNKTIAVGITYTDEYAIIVYDAEDETRNAYAPIEGMTGSSSYLDGREPTKDGYIFSGWQISDYNQTTRKYVAKSANINLTGDVLSSVAENQIAKGTVDGHIIVADVAEPTSASDVAVGTWVLEGTTNSGKYVVVPAWTTGAKMVVTETNTIAATDITDAHQGYLTLLDKLVAAYDRIEPTVKFATPIDLMDPCYALGEVTVKGASIYAEVSAGVATGNWLSYKTTLTGAGMTFDYDEEIVFEVNRTAEDLDEDCTLKVLVGTTELKPNADGKYVLDLSKFAYDQADETLVVRIIYAEQFVTFAKGLDTVSGQAVVGSSSYTLADGLGAIDASAINTAIDEADEVVYLKVAYTEGEVSTPEIWLYINLPEDNTVKANNVGLTLTSANYEDGFLKIASYTTASAVKTKSYAHVITVYNAEEEATVAYVILFTVA